MQDYHGVIGVGNVYAVGQNSIEGATVYSNGNAEIVTVCIAVDIDFAFNVHCLTNDTCNIYCDDVPGCENAMVRCYFGATCTVICNFALESEDCPVVTLYNQTHEIIPPIPTMPTTTTVFGLETGASSTYTSTSATASTTSGIAVTGHETTATTCESTRAPLSATTTTDSEQETENTNANVELAQLINSWQIAGYLRLLGSLFTPFF